CTVQLKNLSTPKRIGATVKPIRSSQNAWWAAAPTSACAAVAARPFDGPVVFSARGGASSLVLDMGLLLPAARPAVGTGPARASIACSPVGVARREVLTS